MKKRYTGQTSGIDATALEKWDLSRLHRKYGLAWGPSPVSTDTRDTDQLWRSKYPNDLVGRYVVPMRASNPDAGDDFGDYDAPAATYGDPGVSCPTKDQVYAYWAANYSGTTVDDATGGAYCHQDNLAGDGNFASATDWTAGTGWTVDTANNKATKTDGNENTLVYSYSGAIGIATKQPYIVTYTVAKTAGDGITVSIGGTAGTKRTGSDTYTETIVSSDATKLTFTPTSDWAGSISAVTVKERKVWFGSADATLPFHLLRFAESHVTDMIWDWMDTAVFWTGNNIKLLVHDVFSFSAYLTANYDGDVYYGTTSAVAEERWYEYAVALKAYCESKGVLIVANATGNQFSTGTYTFFDLLDVIDGILAEECMWRTSFHPWYAASFWDYNIRQYLLNAQYCWAHNKIFSAVVGYTGNVGLTILNENGDSSSLVITVLGQTVTLKLGAGGDTNSINLQTGNSGSYHTMASLATAINTLYSGDGITATAAYNLFTDDPATLLKVGATTCTTAAGTTSVYMIQPSRTQALTAAALLYLSGVPSDADLFWSIGKDSEDSVCTDSDIYEALDLLGEPVESTETDAWGQTVNWLKLDDTYDEGTSGATGSIYYKVYTNGVVFVNWTTEDAYEIACNNELWGSPAAWYPVSQNYFNSEGAMTSESATSITLNGHRGDICLFAV